MSRSSSHTSPLGAARARWPVALAVAIAAAVSTAQSAFAHHSFAMFDHLNERWLTGTVREFQWRNPHAFIQLEVVEEDRTVEWSLEGGSPNILVRNGWKRTSLQPGEQVRVLIYPLLSGEPGGSFLEVHKENGEVLYYHG